MNSSEPIYLDYHATTPVDQRVVEDMLPFFTKHYGNAASRSHPYGWKANEAVELARGQLADLINAHADEIHFNSGATEGLNMAIKGMAESSFSNKKHIISVSTEHSAVLDPLQWLAKRGYEVELLPVDTSGNIEIQQLSDRVGDNTLMVVVMWVNNETGVIHDIKSIGEICARQGVAFICDATQAVGKIPIDLHSHKIDMLALSAHKFYGPKGTGALAIAANEKMIKPDALIHGGGHEKNFRSGTLNVPGIVGLGKAATLCTQYMSDDVKRMTFIRDQFENDIITSCEGISINGGIKDRVSTVSNFKVPFVDSQAVMTKLRTKISISSGSACSSADPSPSHVLKSMGLSDGEAKGSFRISFGRPTTAEESSMAAKMLADAINEYRDQSPVWQMFKQGIDVSEPNRQGT